MACKIEIRNTIDASILDKTNNDYWGFSKQEASKIATFLNDIWGDIAEITESSSDGGYRVITSNIDLATDREYENQLIAENSFERDLDFFNEDVALFEQEAAEFIESDILNEPKTEDPLVEIEEVEEPQEETELSDEYDVISEDENNEDLTDNINLEEVDNELNSKFDDLLNKGIISQVCN